MQMILFPTGWQLLWMVMVWGSDYDWKAQKMKLMMYGFTSCLIVFISWDGERKIIWSWIFLLVSFVYSMNSCIQLLHSYHRVHCYEWSKWKARNHIINFVRINWCYCWFFICYGCFKTKWQPCLVHVYALIKLLCYGASTIHECIMAIFIKVCTVWKLSYQTLM